MRKVTFMGIDGSGKTTLMLALKKAIGEAASFLHSPDFHEIPGFAGAEESRALTEFSRLADAYADPGLKLTSLYLRMCLFGEAEAHLASTERRNTLCIERHALIDSLTYLPVYIAAMKRSGLRAGDSAFVMLQIGNRHPVVFQAVHAALARRDRRLGIDSPTVGSVAEYCMGFGDLSASDFVESLARDYQTGLPDSLLYLDIPPEVAFERICARGKPLEAHETLENLTRLDKLARSGFSDFEALGVRCQTLPVTKLPESELIAIVSGHVLAPTA